MLVGFVELFSKPCCFGHLRTTRGAGIGSIYSWLGCSSKLMMTAQTSRILIYPTTPARLAISGSSDEDSSAAAAAACAKEKGPASLTSKSVQPQLPQAPPPPRLFFWQPATKIGRRNCVMLRWRIGMQWASASSSPASFAMCSASQAKLAWRCCGCGAAVRASFAASSILAKVCEGPRSRLPTQSLAF